MTTAFVVALSAIVWLYSVVAMNRGGGFATTIAVFASTAAAFGGVIACLVSGHVIWAYIITAAIYAAFLVQIRARDDGLLN